MVCGKDSDGDGYADMKLNCDDPQCVQVSCSVKSCYMQTFAIPFIIFAIELVLFDYQFINFMACYILN